MRIQSNLQPTVCLLCLLLAVVIKSSAAVLNPVVLIPGDGGSQMDARLNKTDTVHYICQKKSDTFNLWLNMELLVYGVIDCFIDNIKLTYDNVTRKTTNSPGVDIWIPRFGSSETVEWLDPSHASVGSYFNKIADMLVLNGHTRNLTIRGAPYDFRKAPNENYEYFVQLKALIEETYAQNNNTPVILIAHSMGGPMTLYFLNLQTQAWKDQHIKSMVTLSGAWGGSVKAVKVYAIGDDLGSYFLSGSVLKQEQITNPSLAWLLPSSLFWKPDEVLVQTDKKNYSLSNIKEYFYDLDYMDGWDMHKDTKPYTLNFTAPGVEVHCLYGTAVPTVEKLYYKPGTWLDGKPTLINGDGDGTVNGTKMY
ncbi:phospholipase A2 group XV-like isoform X2 [Atheta coriaria]|uniref:phospholipase A2 group XV-like isoform X2 n=1 Tax=Dalotia coriaria TaxID=877792 RepID=UPI0031F400E0